jgi:hypothetical protein
MAAQADLLIAVVGLLAGLAAAAVAMTAPIGVLAQHLLRGKEAPVALKQVELEVGQAAAALVLLELANPLMLGVMAAMATLLLYLAEHMLAAAAAAALGQPERVGQGAVGRAILLGHVLPQPRQL